MSLLCLFKLFYHVWVCDSDFEVYWVCYRIVGLFYVSWSVVAVHSATSLHFEILVIPSLLLFPSCTLHLFCLGSIDLIPGYLFIIISFLISFS